MGEEVEDEDSHVFTHDEMLTAHNMPNVSFVFSGSDRVYTLRPNEVIFFVNCLLKFLVLYFFFSNIPLLVSFVVHHPGWRTIR